MSAPDVPADLHLGRDGYLFVVSGSNNVLEQYEESDRNSYNLIRWRETILQRSRRLRARGIAYRHLVAPEKVSILPDKMAGIALDVRLSPARRLYADDPLYAAGRGGVPAYLRHLRRQRHWRSICIDLFGPMTEAADRDSLYFKVDSHWSFKGRAFAYRRVCAAVGARPVSSFADRKIQHIPDFAGDLGGRCSPPVTEDQHIVHAQRDAVRFYASPIVLHRERMGLGATLHTGAHVAYRNARANDPRRILLFGDSFSHWAPIMLTVLLAETFRELHFVWSTSVDFGLVDRVKPDLVLTEMAERFLHQTVDDDFDVERYAQERFGAELSAAEAPGAGCAAG
jgi:hypothetical protein